MTRDAEVGCFFPFQDLGDQDLEWINWWGDEYNTEERKDRLIEM